MPKNEIEVNIESAFVKRVEALGGIAEKVTVLGRRGFYDRLCLFPGGRVMFVELKRPRGGRLSKHQKERHALYRSLGAEVVVVKTREDIARLLG